MPKPRSFFRLFTESGPLIALAVAAALLVGVVGPASAQFFNFGGPPRPQPQQQQPPRSSGGGFGGWFGGGLVTPIPQPPQQAPERIEKFSTAPPPETRETRAERKGLGPGGGTT